MSDNKWKMRPNMTFAEMYSQIYEILKEVNDKEIAKMVMADALYETLRNQYAHMPVIHWQLLERKP